MDEKVLKNSNLNFNGFSSTNPNYMAAVEIVVPFYGQYNKISRLIDSIFSTVNNNRYQLTLVDDGSPNEGFIGQIKEKAMPGLHCLRLKKNSGFGAAVNYALENCINDWIPFVCIMHSDTIPVDSSWLSQLGSFLNQVKKDNIKMVSPRSGVFNDEMKHLQTERSVKSEDRILSSEEYLPMFCSLAHRDLFKHVGRFREFPLAGCESMDYAMRMNSMGFKQAVSGKSWVEHEGRGTIDSLDGKMKEMLRKTHDEFVASLNTTVSKV